MTGRYAGVRLERIDRCCPSCHAPRTIRTEPRRGTIVAASCSPYTCRIARTLALGSSLIARRGEFLPADDRGQSRDRWARPGAA